MKSSLKHEELTGTPTPSPEVRESRCRPSAHLCPLLQCTNKNNTQLLGLKQRPKGKKYVKHLAVSSGYRALSIDLVVCVASIWKHGVTAVEVSVLGILGKVPSYFLQLWGGQCHQLEEQTVSSYR